MCDCVIGGISPSPLLFVFLISEYLGHAASNLDSSDEDELNDIEGMGGGVYKGEIGNRLATGILGEIFLKLLEP